QNLAPFARAARPALIDLGNESQQSQPALLATIPLAQRLDRLGTQAKPAAASLDKLTSSLDQTGAIEFLMSLLYYGTSATNTFDSVGHFARNEPQVGGCTSYSLQPIGNCLATFGGQGAAADSAGSQAAARAVSQAVSHVENATTQRSSTGSNGSMRALLDYLLGRSR